MEILAPEETPVRFLRRLDDILTMACEHLWLLDPIDRVALTYTQGGLRLVLGPSLTIPGSPIHIDLPELFTLLD